MFSSFPHRHGDATGKRETRDKTRGCRKTSISYETSSNFEILWTSSNRLECQKVPRLPRKNDMTTCLETFETDRFSSFPHRHGDATRKPATRDKTHGCRKTSISYETSSNFEILWTSSNRLECHKVPRLPRKTTWQLPWKPSKRRGFAASLIDTANPQENQRLETRHVGAPKRSFRTRLPAIFTIGNINKRPGFAASPIDTARPRENQRRETRQVGAPQRAFRARLPPIFRLCSSKIDVFLRVFLRSWKFVTSKSMFCARLPSIFSTCEKMPRLPRNLHLVTTWRSPANAIYKKTRKRTRLKCCACHEKWRWTRPKCCACHENCNTSSENVTKVLRLPRKTMFNTLHNTSECHEVPRLPRETKQRHAWHLQKWPPLQNLPIGTAIRGSRERLRTVATVNATSSEHTLNPQTPRVKREPLATHSGKNKNIWSYNTKR